MHEGAVPIGQLANKFSLGPLRNRYAGGSEIQRISLCLCVRGTESGLREDRERDGRRSMVSRTDFIVASDDDWAGDWDWRRVRVSKANRFRQRWKRSQ